MTDGVASDGDLPGRAQRSEHDGEVAGDRTPASCKYLVFLLLPGGKIVHFGKVEEVP
jgi:hypothetical protein